jgi:hypothetical protein
LNSHARMQPLDECSAVIFSGSDSTLPSMRDLGTQLGFGQVVDQSQLASIAENRLIYFLVHDIMADPAKTRLLQTIRAQSNPLRRYAPVICIVPSGPRHRIIALIDIGFDEVLFLVDGREEMARKLVAQLHHEHIYVDTGKYFGPDRRRLELVDRGDPRRKHHGADDCRKIRVIRDPQSGITATDQL